MANENVKENPIEDLTLFSSLRKMKFIEKDLLCKLARIESDIDNIADKYRHKKKRIIDLNFCRRNLYIKTIRRYSRNMIFNCWCKILINLFFTIVDVYLILCCMSFLFDYYFEKNVVSMMFEVVVPPFIHDSVFIYYSLLVTLFILLIMFIYNIVVRHSSVITQIRLIQNELEVYVSITPEPQYDYINAKIHKTSTDIINRLNHNIIKTLLDND